MAPTTASHARSHSLLLLQKLLNLRDGASPLTLLLDNLEQRAQPLVSDFVSRAKISKSKVIFLSFATLRQPKNVDVFVKASGRDLDTVREELLSHYPALDAAAVRGKPSQRAVLIVDSLNALASTAPESLAIFLSSILTSVVSIVAVYHTDVPVILPKSCNEYEPHPFRILCHLATAILRLSSLRQEIERQKARNRSIEEPEWGLQEDREGAIIGLRTRSRENYASDGLVIKMELRRRSGRTVSETFILEPGATPAEPGKVMMLTDHEVFAPTTTVLNDAGEEEAEPESTFSLGLTDKQRKDREGIVLPYFDAQTDIGAGQGGRILYDMDREDDFDDEEDEI